MTVDFHAHILRGVDHGCADTEQCIRQLELMSSLGTELVVATSHFYPEQLSAARYREIVDDAVRALLRSNRELPSIKICLGAEVLVCDGLDRLEGLGDLCIRGTNVILLEMPFGINWNRSIMSVVENIMDQGYTVVLAHIDRYLEKQEREIDALISAGALPQINASAMSFFGMRRKVRPYIESGVVCALGSDLHKVDSSLYKRFSLLKKKIGKEKFDAIMKRTEGLLEGAQVIDLGRKDN